ncbi:unnamed protein product [Amoebophrya sp. A120]|nr:unnamed protein product [Amoebophrya sp. A120]|eukprot:GSA120T00020177001.1
MGSKKKSMDRNFSSFSQFIDSSCQDLIAFLENYADKENKTQKFSKLFFQQLQSSCLRSRSSSKESPPFDKKHNKHLHEKRSRLIAKSSKLCRWLFSSSKSKAHFPKPLFLDQIFLALAVFELIAFFLAVLNNIAFLEKRSFLITSSPRTAAREDAALYFLTKPPDTEENQNYDFLRSNSSSPTSTFPFPSTSPFLFASALSISSTSPDKIRSTSTPQERISTSVSPAHFLQGGGAAAASKSSSNQEDFNEVARGPSGGPAVRESSRVFNPISRPTSAHVTTQRLSSRVFPVAPETPHAEVPPVQEEVQEQAGVNMSDEEQLTIATFMSTTGCEDMMQARHFLEMSGQVWDLETAVALYLDNMPNAASTGGAGPDGSGRPPPGGGDTGAAPIDEEVRAAIAAFDDQMIQGPSASEKKAQEKQLQEDHRKYLQRSAWWDASKDKKQGAATEANDRVKHLNKIFQVPDYNESGAFAIAHTRAMEENKYILVNIQDQEFPSSQLNRDVWNHELVKDTVTSNFVFWQRDDVSEQGSTFSQYYNVKSLPYICFVDPRTRMAVEFWEGKKWMDPHNPKNSSVVAMEKITAFLEKHADKLRPQQPGSSSRAVSSSSSATGATSTSGANGTGDLAAASGGGTIDLTGGTSGGSRPAHGDEPMSKRPRSAGGLTQGGETGASSSTAAFGSTGETTAEQAAAAEEDVPAMPPAPAAGTDPATLAKMSFRLLDGKRSDPVLFLKTDPVSHALQAAAHLSKMGIESVDLFTAMPPKSARKDIGLDTTIGDAGLSGSMLNVRKAK